MHQDQRPRRSPQRLRKKDDVVDELYTAVKLYLTQISREALDEKEGRRWADIVSFTINLEQVGDIIERVLTDIEDKKIAKHRSFSDAGMAEICDLHARLVANLRLGMSVFLHGDLKSAQELLAQKVLFRDLERAYADSHLGRLAGNTLESIETSSLHLDLISDLKRINSHICSIAYPILEEAGVLARTRLKEPEPAPPRRRSGGRPSRRRESRLAETQAAHAPDATRTRMALSISDICILFARKGGRAYDGEPVTQLEHALQTATRAEDAGASPALVTAALLHDLGHLLNDQGDTPTLRGVDDLHQYAALPFLRALFGDDVLAPIKLHVDAKRYLCATRADYYDALSVDSKRSLVLQGGIFTPAGSRRVHRAAARRGRRRRAPVGRSRQGRRRAHAAARALRRRARSRAATAPVHPATRRRRRAVELTLGVTLAVLGAGLLHAGWNALLKSAGGGDPLLDTATIVAGSTVCSLVALPFVPAAARRSVAVWRSRRWSSISATT